MFQDDLLGASFLGRSNSVLGGLSFAEQRTVRAFAAVVISVALLVVMVGVGALLLTKRAATPVDVEAASEIVG